jgi:signal transduction histidine kinase
MVRRISRGLLIAGLVMFWLIDVLLALDTPAYPLLVTGLVPAAALLLKRWGQLEVRLSVAATWAWAVTVLTLAAGPADFRTIGVLDLAVIPLLMITAARHAAPKSAAFALCAALGTVYIALPLRGDMPGEEVLFFSFLLTFVAGGALGLGLYLRILDTQRQRSVDQVRHNERLELARDLHDFVAHHITGIVVQSQAARAVWETSPQEVKPILENIERAGIETLTSMRRLVRVLREDEEASTKPGAEGIGGITETVEQYRRSWHGRRPQITLELSNAARAADLAPEVAATAHRIVTEGLTNIRRHAPDTALVHVTVNAGPGGLEVTVRNSEPPPGSRRAGRSGPLGGRGGFGLVGLHERVQAVGGTLVVGPRPGGGWEVAALLPVGSENLASFSG